MVSVRRIAGKSGSFTRGAVSLGSGNIRFAAAGVTALVGIITTLNTAVAKTPSNVSLPFATKLFYVGGRIIGGQTLWTLLGGNNPGSIALQIPFTGPGGAVQVSQGINPFGWANTTTLAGGITLLVNGAIHMAHLPFYNQYVGPFIAALGLGLLIGGVAGGILDDPPTGTPTSYSTANTPVAAPSGGLTF